jgi:hypothetical protein
VPPPSSRRPDGSAAGQTNSPWLSDRNPSWPGLWPEWLANLILDLGAAGMGVAAERVGDALGKVDPGRQASFDADVAVAVEREPQPRVPSSSGSDGVRRPGERPIHSSRTRS